MLHRLGVLCCSLWVCLVSCCALAAEARQGSLDQQLVADARDGSLDRFDLPTACLIAGGVTDERELAHERRRLDAICKSIVNPSLAELSAAERAQILCQQLHARVLVGRYERIATDWRVTLDRGDFNCLSALLIYHELCRQAGVPLEVWCEPGHVFGRLPVGVRIEPTSRRWLAPVPRPGQDALPRQLTHAQLVGRCYYNRGIELLEKQQFAAGVAALRMACQLDPHDADARENLLAGLNNWALHLSAQDDHAAAAALIARGLAIDPTFPPLVANQRYLRTLVQP